jgi:hypothetical protein
MDKITPEEILDSFNLHTTYYPYYSNHNKKEAAHDIDCHFCKYEDDILKAMKKFGEQCFEAGIKEGIKHERKNRLNISPFNYNYTSFEDYLKEIENEK